MERRRRTLTPQINSKNDPNRDLGLDGRIAEQSQVRVLNKDGSFNVARLGLSLRDFIHPYHRLLTVSWPGFFALVTAAYLAINVLFACAYLLCGPGALSGVSAATAAGRFWDAFFFSVQTLATIGYGKMTPEGLAANSLVAIEALAGLLGFAFATGLLFARFSRPMAGILFSPAAIVSPYRGGTGLMFRVANGRSNELTEVQATVNLSRWETVDGVRRRKFHVLALERAKVTFLPLQWVVVHPIDESSPLFGINQETFAASEPEILILMSAMDETFSQLVHARSSYLIQEIVWGAKFRDIYETTGDGRLAINVRRLGEADRISLP